MIFDTRMTTPEACFN